MAIELIEENELSALAPSRLHGSRTFVNELDGSYIGFTSPKTYSKGRSSEIENNYKTWDDKTFVDKMVTAFQFIRRDSANTWIAQQNIKNNGAKGVEINRQLVEKLGVPFEAEALRTYNAYFTVYKDYYIPTDAKVGSLSCDVLTQMATNIQIDIDRYNKQGTGGQKGRITNRNIQALFDKQSMVEKMLGEARCSETKAKAEESAAKEELRQELEKATRGEGTTDKTTKYIIYGVGGLILLSGIVLLLKPSRP